MQNNQRRVALVEDEADLRENYTMALEQCGFTVESYAERETAQAAFSVKLPDLVIIDVGLAHEYEGGFDLCRFLRERSASLPIIFLSARDSELDVISGLRLGADDYLTKDISLNHLIARVTALFRRLEVLKQEWRFQGETEQFSQLQIDVERLSLCWKGQEVKLTVTEFWIVYALARHPGQVKSRQQLMDAANLVLDDQTITAHIKRIRKKFIAYDEHFSSIESVYAAGYRWVEASF